ncbi:hypothetical protein QR680_009360 [Steinernema hermaphroditum]|uniref:Uncharacterized protein n=1 Tax=Steinernema hermaphroditum TaxID=289476 RepID=A0AA39IK09_9BILA|nr:hypothetical protein QR680_009360 [Steinernema hermaphroditum]
MQSSPELVEVARSLSSDDSGFKSDLLQNAEDVEDELESEDELGSDDSSMSEDDTSPRHIGRPVTFTISQKGKQLANFLGFEFHRHSSVKTSVRQRQRKCTHSEGLFEANGVELTSMSTDQIVTVVRSEVHPASRITWECASVSKNHTKSESEAESGQATECNVAC